MQPLPPQQSPIALNWNSVCPYSHEGIYVSCRFKLDSEMARWPRRKNVLSPGLRLVLNIENDASLSNGKRAKTNVH